jgi:hypothetical protein
LPTDFAIFSSPNWSIPLCIHSRDSGLARAASVWAISFSWWGKIRSLPPPCTSKSTPRIPSAIAEHSMCQPGRPRPQGASQAVSSPSFCAFHSAKSCADSLRSSRRSSSSSVCTMSSSLRFESFPYSGNEGTRK